MAAGLAALLDDIAALAKLAASSIDDVGAAAGKASAKAAGVVVDDTAVTPQYVQGVAAEREIPIVRKIAVGSLRNKLVFILPAALLLSQFMPWLLTPILMVGGTYLCFEGAEKILELFGGHGPDEPAAVSEAGKTEDEVVSGAIRTDFILSAEIMVISLNEVATEPLVSRTLILIVVAVAITLLVYGIVGVIVKMDDIGLRMTRSDNEATQRFGRRLVAAMPMVLNIISWVGMAAMLWVGGHILVVGANELGWHTPYEAIHHIEHAVHQGVPHAIAGVAGWVTDTIASAIVGVTVGGIVVAVLHALPFGHHDEAPTSEHTHRDSASHDSGDDVVDSHSSSYEDE